MLKETPFRLAVVALFVLACYGMSEAVEKQQSTFANLMMKNLSDLFSGMKAIYENHRDTHLGIPKTKIGLSSLISNVFLSMFGNTAVFVMLKRQVEVRKFLWILWLYGGPATGEENTLVNHCASAACIARISLAGDTGYSLISDLLGVYNPLWRTRSCREDHTYWSSPFHTIERTHFGRPATLHHSLDLPRRQARPCYFEENGRNGRNREAHRRGSRNLRLHIAQKSIIQEWILQRRHSLKSSSTC